MWPLELILELIYLFRGICSQGREVEYASEFRYRNPILFKDDVILVISQSSNAQNFCRCQASIAPFHIHVSNHPFRSPPLSLSDSLSQT